MVTSGRARRMSWLAWLLGVDGPLLPGSVASENGGPPNVTQGQRTAGYQSPQDHSPWIRTSP